MANEFWDLIEDTWNQSVKEQLTVANVFYHDPPIVAVQSPSSTSGPKWKTEPWPEWEARFGEYAGGETDKLGASGIRTRWVESKTPGKVIGDLIARGAKWITVRNPVPSRADGRQRVHYERPNLPPPAPKPAPEWVPTDHSVMAFPPPWQLSSPKRTAAYVRPDQREVLALVDNAKGYGVRSWFSKDRSLFTSLNPGIGYEVYMKVATVK